jgi:SsrA-binding protein
MSKPQDTGDALVADNRKAGFDYHILETFEAGVALLGTEVKSAREGRVNLRDSYCRLQNGEAYLLGVHIGQYSHDGGYTVHDPTRPRKLLLHREELRKLLGKTTEKGLTIVPLRMYFKKGRIKVAIALVKGKKSYDKRETIKRRETERETRAAVKSGRL